METAVNEFDPQARFEAIERDRRKRERELLLLLLLTFDDQVVPALTGALARAAVAGHPPLEYARLAIDRYLYAGGRLARQVAQTMADAALDAYNAMRRFAGLVPDLSLGKLRATLARQAAKAGAVVADMGARLKTDLSRWLAEAKAGGVEFVAAVKQGLVDSGWTAAKPSALELVADQTVLNAYGDSLHDAAHDPDVWRRLRGFRHASKIDERTTTICFTGSTIVSPVGNSRRLFRRLYEGDILIVRTSGGHQMEVTPRHPVLTARGWLGADELKPSQDIVYSVTGGGFCIRCRKYVRVPSTFAELADTVFEPSISDIERKRATTADFHGDGNRGDRYVDVARIKSHLGYDPVTGLSQLGTNELLRRHGEIVGIVGTPLSRRKQLCVSGALSDVPAENRPALPQSIKNPIPATPDGPLDLDGADTGGVHFDRPRHVPLRDFRAVTAGHVWHYAKLAELFSNRRDGYVKFPCQRCGRPSVAIEANHVIDVRSEFRSCHVYNLETSQGCYIADSMIVKNCRPRNGLTLRKDHPYWQTHWPSLHFRCRSLAVPIFAGEPFEESDWMVDDSDPAVAPMKGFGVAPEWLRALAG